MNKFLLTILIVLVQYAAVIATATAAEMDAKTKAANCFDHQIENWGDLIGEMDSDSTVDYAIRLKYAVLECMEKPDAK